MSKPEDIDELISRMNSKKNDHHSNDLIKKKGLNYYAIIGVDPTATQLDIKRAYQRKLKSYHPDKIEQTPENIAKYKLIREAGETLKDPYKRKAYDAEQTSDHISDNFWTQRNCYKEFVELQKQTHHDKEQSNPQRKNVEEVTMSKEEHHRRCEDAIMQREMEELDIGCDKLFDGKTMNSDEFNKEFNKLFEKKKARNKKKSDIVKCEDIVAFNNESYADVATVDQYDKLYTDEKFAGCNEKYAGITTGTANEDSDDLSIGSLDNENDQKIETSQNIEEAISNIMAERKMQDHKFDAMSDADFKSALDDKFGVSHGIGFLVGGNMGGNQVRKPNAHISDDNLRAYRSLIGTTK